MNAKWRLQLKPFDINDIKRFRSISFEYCRLLKSQAMKLFEPVLEYSALIGIRPLRPNEASVFNQRNTTFSVFYLLCSISSALSLYFDANTFYEYCQAFYFFISLTLVGIGLFINILLSKNTFRLKDTFEIIIGKCMNKIQIKKN